MAANVPRAPHEHGPRVLGASATGSGREAAVAAARRLVAALVSTDADDDEFVEVARQLEAQASFLEERGTRTQHERGIPRTSPVTGIENPIAPPLALDGLVGGEVRGATSLGIAYQGRPGFAHGGISALLLDHALGMASWWGGAVGMTASLHLDFHRPVPLDRPLEVTAGLVGKEGRKGTVDGAIRFDGKDCVTARGVFVEPREGRPGSFSTREKGLPDGG